MGLVVSIPRPYPQAVIPPHTPSCPPESEVGRKPKTRSGASDATSADAKERRANPGMNCE